jgi:hypothetical protein
MTTLPHETSPGAPAAPDAWEAPSTRVPRALLAAALVFLGGYLLVASLNGQLVASVAGLGPSSPGVMLLLIGHFAFALLVVVAGLLASSAAAGSKAVASAIVVVGAIVVVALNAMRFAGDLRVPAIPGQFTFANAWVMTTLFVGVAWLLVRRARLGWLALAGVLVLAPIPFWFTLAGAEGALTQFAMFALTGIVGAGIIAAGRPWRD